MGFVGCVVTGRQQQGQQQGTEEATCNSESAADGISMPGALPCQEDNPQIGARTGFLACCAPPFIA